MKPDLAAMQLASEQLADYLGQAAAIALDACREGAPDSEVFGAHRIVNSYIELARGALDSFEEAARG